MSVLARSVGNAFRNKIRSGAVVVILAVAIGLALSMLVANQAVADRITSLKASVGNNLTVNPAGARGAEGGGEPLTGADVTKAKAVAHVNAVTGTLSLRLQNATTAAAEAAAGTQQGGRGGGFGGSSASGTTSLTSAVAPGTLGNRQNSSGTGTTGSSADGTTRPAFTIPIQATGISGALDATGNAINITGGSALSDFTATSTQALVGSTLATKNSLKAGSTFTVNDRTMTVAGIFDAGTAFDNNGIYLPLAAAQTLTSQADQLSTLTVTVDSIENVDATKTAVADALGSSRVDVTAGSRNLDVRGQFALQRAEHLADRVYRRSGHRGADRAADHDHGGPRAPPRDRRAEGYRRFQPHHRRPVRLRIAGAGGDGLRSRRGGGRVQLQRHCWCAGLQQHDDDGGRWLPWCWGRCRCGRPGCRAGRWLRPGAGRGAFSGASQLIGTISTSLGWQTLVVGVLGILAIAALGALIPALLTAKVRPIEVLRGE